VAAMEETAEGSVLIGTKVLLWKFMARPVAAVKSSRTFFKIIHVLRNGVNDNKGIVGVLENKIRKIINKRME
jgi:hypothetical protein